MVMNIKGVKYKSMYKRSLKELRDFINDQIKTTKSHKKKKKKLEKPEPEPIDDISFDDISFDSVSTLSESSGASLE